MPSGFPYSPNPNTPSGLLALLAQSDLKPLQKKNEYFTGPLAGARTSDVINISGAGIVTQLQLRVGNAVFQNDGMIEIYIDGAANGSPSIRIPFGILLGNVNGQALNATSAGYIVDSTHAIFGNNALHTAHFGINYDAYNVQNAAAAQGLMEMIFTFPIPYATGFRVALWSSGADANSTNYWCTATYTSQVLSTLRLQGQGTPTIVPGTSPYGNATTAAASATKDLFTLAQGANPPNLGWLVAFWACVGSFGTDATGQTCFERNVSMYRNGQGTADYQSTGWEDFFDSQGYWSGLAYEQSSPNAYLSLLRLAGGGGNTQSGMFKDILGDCGGFGYSDGCILRSENEPDNGAGRLTTTTVYTTFCLYYKVGN